MSKLYPVTLLIVKFTLYTPCSGTDPYSFELNVAKSPTRTVATYIQGGLDMRHQRYLSSQHFYTPVALHNSETTSWSKVGSTKKWPIRRLASSIMEVGHAS